MLSRRDTLLGALALSACQPRPRSETVISEPRFATLEARIGGRVGVAAFNTATNEWFQHRGGEQFAMCSTFKWLLAAQMLRKEQVSPGWMQERLPYTEADLLDYAPTAREHLARGWMTVEEACQAIVVLSDNTAANLLLIATGAPEGLNEFFHNHGPASTRLDRLEPELNENLPDDPRDSTTPESMARGLERMLVGDMVLNAASREKLIGWMIDSPTGRERLRAGVPSHWRVGDKTGTWNGEHNATNDVAIAWPPTGAPILIAVYLSESTVEPAARNAAHAEIARIVVEKWG